MKKILLILFASCSGVMAQTNVTPISQFPNVGPTPNTNYETVLASPGAGNYNWSIGQMIAFFNSALNFSTNTSFVTNYYTNFYYQTNWYTNQYYYTNSYYVTNYYTNGNIIGAIEYGIIVAPASATSSTNFYWLDFGQTNIYNQNAIYAALLATNNVYFLGVTNLSIWKLLSINVVASGANRVISVPNSWPHFNTNGWLSSGNQFYLTLTNGNELRLTIQSNITLSTTWTTFGQ